MKRLILLAAALAFGAGCQPADTPAVPAAPETTFVPAQSLSAPSPAAPSPAASPAAALPAQTAVVATPPPPTLAVPTVTTPIAGAVVSPTVAATTGPPGAPAIPAATPLLPGQPTPQPASPGPTQPGGPPAGTPAATPTPWLPQTRQVGQVRVRLLEYVRGQTPDGRPIVRLKTELTNEGDRAAFFADLYFSLRTAEGQQVDPITNVASDERMNQGPLAPGQSTTGFLWYLVPETTRIAAVHYDGPTGQTSFPVPG